MNNDTPADAITVTQADRDLVYEIMLPLATSAVEHKALEYIKQGCGDDAEAVQAVARHRTTSLAAQDGLVDALREIREEMRYYEHPLARKAFRISNTALASIEVKS